MREDDWESNCTEYLTGTGKERHIEQIIDYLNENGGHHYGTDRSARGAIPPHLDRLGYPRTRAWGCWFKARTDDAVSSCQIADTPR